LPIQEFSYYIPQEEEPCIIKYEWKELPETTQWSKSPSSIIFYDNKIAPEEIPYTSNWNYRGTNLKGHISSEHGIEINRMSKLSHYDLVRLHSYIHNGGRKFGGF
jgi:hypothetical protein